MGDKALKNGIKAIKPNPDEITYVRVTSIPEVYISFVGEIRHGKPLVKYRDFYSKNEDFGEYSSFKSEQGFEFEEITKEEFDKLKLMEALQ